MDDGADCDSVAEPDEARPDEPLTPRHESEPAWMVTGAVAAVAPVESVRVRVIDVPAAMLTVQVNWVSVVGCAPRTASGLHVRNETFSTKASAPSHMETGRKGPDRAGCNLRAGELAARKDTDLHDRKDRGQFVVHSSQKKVMKVD